MWEDSIDNNGDRNICFNEMSNIAKTAINALHYQLREEDNERVDQE